MTSWLNWLIGELVELVEFVGSTYTYALIDGMEKSALNRFILPPFDKCFTGFMPNFQGFRMILCLY